MEEEAGGFTQLSVRLKGKEGRCLFKHLQRHDGPTAGQGGGDARQRSMSCVWARSRVNHHVAEVARRSGLVMLCDAESAVGDGNHME